jgi:hypothetical protein
MESIARTEIRVPAGMVTEGTDFATSSCPIAEGALGCFEGTEGEAPCASESESQRTDKHAQKHCKNSEFVDVSSIIATAILDRLLHHSTTINIRGESYRLKERRRAGLIGGREQEGSAGVGSAPAGLPLLPATPAPALSLAPASALPRRQKPAPGFAASGAKENHS